MYMLLQINCILQEVQFTDQQRFKQFVSQSKARMEVYYKFILKWQMNRTDPSISNQSLKSLCYSFSEPIER